MPERYTPDADEWQRLEKHIDAEARRRGGERFYDDLREAALNGLAAACESFDPQHVSGATFVTFARRCIDYAMKACSRQRNQRAPLKLTLAVDTPRERAPRWWPDPEKIESRSDPAFQAWLNASTAKLASLIAAEKESELTAAPGSCPSEAPTDGGPYFPSADEAPLRKRVHRAPFEPGEQSQSPETMILRHADQVSQEQRIREAVSAGDVPAGKITIAVEAGALDTESAKLAHKRRISEVRRAAARERWRRHDASVSRRTVA